MMSQTMQAIVCHGPADYHLEQVPTPEAGPGEVVVKVHACGICAGDVKCYHGAPLFWGDETREPYANPPFIPGHEFIGEVVELGAGAADRHGLRVGDLAIAEQIVPCWRCRFCNRGQYWMCQVHDIFGFRGNLPGGMAEFMKYPAGAIIHRVPRELDIAQAAVIEPLACSIHAVQRGEIALGDVVVIAGCGTLGLGMVATARLRNPGRLIALDNLDSRLRIAQQLGADLTLNPSQEDVVGAILDLTDGYGCDVYIEATGHPSAVTQGLRMIRKLGTFVEFSVMAEPVTVDWTIIGDTKELDIHGAHLAPYTYPLAIESIRRGQVDVAPLVTHQIPLGDFQAGLEMAANPRDSIKVLVRP